MNKEDLIGTFQGTPVYQTTLPEYINNRYYISDDSIIYLINQELIRENIVFAKYDGNYVTEYNPHERAKFYTIPTIKRQTPTSSSGNSEENSKIEMKSAEEILAGVFNGGVDAFLKAN